MLIPLFHLMALENQAQLKLFMVETVLCGNEPLTILFCFEGTVGVPELICTVVENGPAGNRNEFSLGIHVA